MATNPLHIAIKRADLAAINALLGQSPAKLATLINEYDNHHKTPLMYAVENNALPWQVAQQLIDRGANLHQETKKMGQHGSIMSLAIKAGDVTKVEALIRAGATLNYLRDSNYGPLLDAVHTPNVAKNSGLLNLLLLLIRHHVDLDIITTYQESALRTLSRLGRFDAVALLLDAGADENQLEWTALAQAVAVGNIDDMKRCIANGSALEDRDWWHRTPYLLAVQTGEIAKVKLLLNAGADSNVAGRCGCPPMVYAISSFHTPMLHWLIENGESVEQPDDFDNTPLLAAVQADNADAVEILLRAGAKLSTSTLVKTPNVAELLGHANAWLKQLGTDADGLAGITEAFNELKQLNADATLEIPAQTGTQRVDSPILNDASSAHVAQILLDAGADPKDLKHGAQRLFVGFALDPDVTYLDNTHAQFLAARTRVFGSRNPEKMDRPFWLAMIRSGVDAFTATEHFKGPSSFEGEPVWCAQRFGQTITFLDDGRIVQIGGEHEDGYDPDFCIYNDVFVHEPKAANGAPGKVTIYGYPEAVFPPTDFHTATLMGKAIIVIGRLGYGGTRVEGETPVYSLDTKTFAFKKIITTGNAPGWIYKHRTEKISNEVLRVRGGIIVTGRGDKESHDDNLREFVLDVRSGIWR